MEDYLCISMYGMILSVRNQVQLVCNFIWNYYFSQLSLVGLFDDILIHIKYFNESLLILIHHEHYSLIL